VSAPRSGSNTAIAAWCVGRSVPALPSNSVTSFVSRRFADGRDAGITPSRPWPENAAMRGGIDARPPLRSVNPSARASTRACRSNKATTSARVRIIIASRRSWPCIDKAKSARIGHWLGRYTQAQLPSRDLLQPAERLLVPRDAVGDTGALHAGAVLGVPVVV